MFDINDPSTWPDDQDKLLEIANEATTNDVAGYNAAQFNDTEEEDEDAETPKEGTDQSDQAETETKEETSEEAETEKPADEGTEPEPEPVVLAADNKHTIPFSVLKDIREQNRTLQEELKSLKEQTVQAQTQTQAQQPEPEAPKEDEIPADVQNKINDLRERWGDEMAEMALTNYKLQQRVELQDKALADVRNYQQQDQTTKARSEETQIQEAIDNSPIMAAWQADSSTDWYNKAVSTNQFLIDNDPQYAKLSWPERMQALPAKVQALYGESPHAKQVKPVSEAVSPDEVRAQAEEKVKKAATKTPTTMSDIRGGQAPELEGDVFAEASNMDLTQMYDRMYKLSNDPAKLQAYLSNFT